MITKRRASNDLLFQEILPAISLLYTVTALLNMSDREFQIVHSLIFLGLLVSIVGLGLAQSYGDYESYNVASENYSQISTNWDHSIEVDFSEYWEGENYWGGTHRMYPVRLNTQKLIEKGEMREDCVDVRVASEGNLLGSRVIDSTCNTTETMIYFSNVRSEGELKFDEDGQIDDIQVFYGNKNSGIGEFRASAYNQNIATLIKPESPIEIYYGSHDNTWVEDDTTLERNDQSIPEQEWSVDFQHDHGDEPAEYVYISDGTNSEKQSTSSGGDTHIIDSGNVPSFIEEGDEITIYFESDYESYGGNGRETSSSKSAIWGYPVQFDDPRPAKSNYGSPVDSTSPNLNIDIDEPNGDDVTVSFYDASNNNFIGSDTVYGGSGTATTEWSGLSEANTYEWYAEACSSGCRQTDSDYEFDVNGIPQIENVDVTEAGDNHAFDIEARVTDSNGYNDLDSCDITAQDQSSNSYNYGNVGFESKSGNEAYCRHRIQFNDDADWDHLSTIDFDITVSDSKNTDTYSGTQTFPNHGPSVSSGSFNYDYYSEDHAFNVSATVSDVDATSSNEIDPVCQWEFEDTDGNIITKSSSIDYKSGNNAECSYSNINSSISGFEPTEQISTSLTVTDNHGSSDTEMDTHSIPNRPPEVDALISPADGSLVTGPADLEVDVSDPEGDAFNLTFVDTTTSNTIDFVQNAHISSTTTSWDASLGEHTWRVDMEDPYDSVQSTEWEFTSVISNQFRLDQSVEYDYGSLILTEEGTGNMFVEITNYHPNDKDILTELESKNGHFTASFLQSGTSQTMYTLGQGETKTLQIQVNGDSVAESRKDKLILTSTDQNVGAVSTEELDVLVRSSEAEFRDAPGLTSIYLVFIGLVSVLLFGLST